MPLVLTGLEPPILHFSKQRSGYLTFNGLCALSDVWHAWFEDDGKPIKNLKILLSILDTETVPAEWLRQRVNEIEYLGEAKRYKTAITPDQVSRLVARLGRGQYGLYFTTSWYSEQTQKEIEADRYPVRLFSGQDIVNILRAGNCVSGGAYSQ